MSTIPRDLTFRYLLGRAPKGRAREWGIDFPYLGNSQEIKNKTRELQGKGLIILTNGEFNTEFLNWINNSFMQVANWRRQLVNWDRKGLNHHLNRMSWWERCLNQLISQPRHAFTYFSMPDDKLKVVRVLHQDLKLLIEDVLHKVIILICT